MSDTPILSAALEKIGRLAREKPEGWADEVDAELEKVANVERDLAAANQRLHEVSGTLYDRILDIEKLEARIEQLEGDGIHTCHDKCQRPLCRIRRELAAANARCDAIWEHCHVVCWPSDGGYPLEHNPAANKDARAWIEKELAARSPAGIPDRAKGGEAT